MTNHRASPPAREAGHQPRDRAVIWHLRRLAIRHRAFTIGYEILGPDGARWVAERKDRKAPGAPFITAASLMELRFALRFDGSGYAR